MGPGPAPKARWSPLVRAGSAGWRRVLIGLAAALIAVVGAQVGPARAQPSLATTIKATFLYKFAAFVEWPTLAGGPGPFTLCVVGADPFGPVLDRVVAGQRIAGQPVLVRRLAVAD